MSHTKRLVLGLGLMTLSVCAALPFRQAAPASTQVADAADNTLSLGEGVSLQMPGQRMSAPLPSQPRPPFPAETEPADPQPMAELRVQEEVSALTKPPALADQYRPLYKPVATTDNSGRVLPLGKQPTPSTKPHKRHTIHDGDTLESLAVRYLGDSQRAAEILELNRNVLSDPELLPIGMTIVIPPAEPAGPADRTDATAGETSSLVPLPTDGFRRGR
jgi:nucleoid-associated protein YgaU